MKDIKESAMAMKQTAISLLPTEVEKSTLLNINSILRQVLNETKMPSEIEVKVEYGDNLPLILADSRWLSLGVFTNLISNSLREMSEGGLLKIVTRRIEQRVEVEVTDTGPGIPDRIAKSPQLFREQIKGTGSSGLGLHLVGTIIRKYGGDIKLTKTDSNGTTFTFWLPIAKSQ